MQVYYIILISTIFFAFLSTDDRLKKSFSISFIILFLYLAFRCDFGIDYPGYVKMFNNIKLDLVKNGDVEYGWYALNYIFPNFELLIFTTSLFYVCTFYFLIKKFVPKEYWWFSVLILVLNFNYLILHASAMRQTIAILLFLNSIPFLLNRNILGYFLLCVLAYSFHRSAIILFPVYFVQYLNSESNLKFWTVVIVLFVTIMFGAEYLSDILSVLLDNMSGGERYQSYLNENHSKTMKFINIGVYLTLIVGLSITEKKQEKKIQIINKVFIIGIISVAFSSTSEMIVRLGYYFLPLSIIVYPYILKSIDNKMFKILFLLGVILVFIKRFSSALDEPLWYYSLINYKTIF